MLLLELENAVDNETGHGDEQLKKCSEQTTRSSTARLFFFSDFISSVLLQHGLLLVLSVISKSMLEN